MITLGGAIGTGLIIATGSGLSVGGPGALLLSFCVVGLAVYMLVCAIGELATFIPDDQAFAGYSSRYVDKALGFTTGYIYWFKHLVVTPNQLTTVSLILQFWVPPSRVHPAVFVSISLVMVVSLNYFGVKIFGEVEFWLSVFKILVLLIMVFVMLVVACGGGPEKQVLGFKYWNDPGAFKPYMAEGAYGYARAVWKTLTIATFALLGIEFIGVAVGEAKNPHKTIPRAIKLTFYRIIFFYLSTIFLLGLCVPHNDPGLEHRKDTTTIASPFVVAIENAKIRYLPGVLNASILFFLISAANTDLYIATRTVYSLAVQGLAPQILAKTNRSGVPIYSLAVSSVFCLLAFMNLSVSSATVFTYLLNLVTIFGVLSWISILTSHICFMRALNAQGWDRKRDLVYYAPFQPYGCYITLAFCVVICFFQGWNACSSSRADTLIFFIALGTALFLFLGYKIVRRTRPIRPEAADLLTGRLELEKEEKRMVEEDEKQLQNESQVQRMIRRIYRKYLSWLF